MLYDNMIFHSVMQDRICIKQRIFDNNNHTNIPFNNVLYKLYGNLLLVGHHRIGDKKGTVNYKIFINVKTMRNKC
jgi:hypothetical protein